MFNEENKNNDSKDKEVNKEVINNTEVDNISEKQLITNYGKTYKVSSIIKLDDEIELEKTFFFKKPTTASFDRYLKSASNSSSRALKTFVQDNIVDEQEHELNAILEEFPAFTLSLGEKLLEMLGLAKEINIKKL